MSYSDNYYQWGHNDRDYRPKIKPKKTSSRRIIITPALFVPPETSSSVITSLPLETPPPLTDLDLNPSTVTLDGSVKRKLTN